MNGIARPTAPPRGGARRVWQTVALTAVLAVVYVATARMGLAIAALHGLASLVWPPTGIAVACLFLFGRGLWPGVALGALTANLMVGAPLPVAAGIAAGNTLEALVAASLLARVGFSPSLERLRDVAALLVLGCALSTMVSATVGVASGWLGGVIPSTDVARTWVTWWLGDGIGLLIVAPPLLILGNRRPTLLKERGIEAALLLVILFVVSLVVFGASIADGAQAYAFAYLVFPFVVWAGLRLGPLGVAVTLLLISAAAITGTARGVSPFAFGTLQQGLLLLQSFMAIVAITGLVLAAVISERELAQAEREAAEEALRKADRRKDNFLATLGHELRNLLAPVRTSTEVLRRAETLESPADVRRVSEIVDRQVTHMVRLADDLLDVARITRGTTRLELQALDLVETVRTAAEDHRSHLEAAGLHLVLDLPDSPLRAGGDPTRLSQVVGNLLHNARKFTDEGGHVTVRLRQAGPVHAELQIADTGIGMSAESLQHAFETFGAVGSSESGLGLGLPLVRGLVEMHGGSVRAVSAGPGLGTTVIIRLPIDRSS